MIRVPVYFTLCRWNHIDRAAGANSVQAGMSTANQVSTVLAVYVFLKTWADPGQSWV